MGAPSTAICQEVAWKSPELRRFWVALVKAALAQSDPDFTSDLVSESLRTATTDAPGTGIAGSAITVLKNASVIKPVGIFQGKTFYASRRASERPGAKCRWLNVYQLTSRSLAEAFVSRNEPAPVAANVSSQPTETQPEIL